MERDGRVLRLVRSSGRAVGREDARTRELNSQLWASARKGKQAVQGLLLTRHESLVGEVDRLLREGAEINSADAFGSPPPPPPPAPAFPSPPPPDRRSKMPAPSWDVVNAARGEEG